MKSQRTFAQMREALKQYNDGLINMAELLMCLQMSDTQLVAVRRSLDLPYKVQAKIQLSDFDEWVRDVEDKADAIAANAASSANVRPPADGYILHSPDLDLVWDNTNRRWSDDIDHATVVPDEFTAIIMRDIAKIDDAVRTHKVHIVRRSDLASESES